MKVDYSTFSCGGLHGKHVVATWKGKTGTIPAFALGPRKTKKNLCRDDELMLAEKTLYMGGVTLVSRQRLKRPIHSKLN
jgi:hypothetical protein